MEEKLYEICSVKNFSTQYILREPSGGGSGSQELSLSNNFKTLNPEIFGT